MPKNVGDSTVQLNDNETGGCWKRKSSLEKKMVVLTVVLFAAFIGVVVALGIVSSKSASATAPAPELETTTSDSIQTTVTKPHDVCYELGCLRAAAYFLETMNTTADPCEDFHEFVCGRWVEDNPMPSDKGRFGVFDGLRDDLAEACVVALESRPLVDKPPNAEDKAGVFYQTCLKTEIADTKESFDQVIELLKAVNISSDFNSVASGFEVYSTLSGIVQSYGLNFILSFGIGADVKNTSRNIISLDQPSSFGLGRSFLVNLDKSSPLVKAYKTYINDAICALNPTPCPLTEDDVNKILDFEVKMAKLTRSPVDRRNASTWYNPMSIEDLDLEVQEISFLDYVNRILDDGVSKDEIVIAKEREYFKQISGLLNSTEQSVVSNYLGWRLVQSLGPSLSRKLREIQFEFNKVSLGIKKAIENEDRCFELTNNYFGHAVGWLYVSTTKFKEESKTKVEVMVEHLKDGFRELVTENTWMDETTKNNSMKKLDKIVRMMAYPEWTSNSSKLNDFYDGIQVRDSSFFENYKNAMSFSVKSTVKKLSKKNDREKDWISAASIVNAFYSSTFNSITFPAGILQNPFYTDRLKVLNYGAIGYVIGHEITHGFDDSGRQYDGDGNLNDWWTENTLNEYLERRDCFIDQYSNIIDPQTGKNLNGNQTIGENIADNGGIRESYRAYFLSGRDETRLPGLGQYSDLQLFYMSAASIWCSQFTKEEMVNQIDQGVHSPGMYRAYIPLANDKGFAEAFNCKPGSKMNPEHRCTIW